MLKKKKSLNKTTLKPITYCINTKQLKFKMDMKNQTSDDNQSQPLSDIDDMFINLREADGRPPSEDTIRRRSKMIGSKGVSYLGSQAGAPCCIYCIHCCLQSQPQMQEFNNTSILESNIHNEKIKLIMNQSMTLGLILVLLLL